MQRGRPRIEREPNERVPMSTRIRGELFNKLSEAAERHDRPLGHEIEQRLEASLAAEAEQIFPQQLRNMALKLIGHYTMMGSGAVVQLLMDLPDPQTFEEPDEIERWRRWQNMTSRLDTMLFLDPRLKEPQEPHRETITEEAERRRRLIENLRVMLDAALNAMDPPGVAAARPCPEARKARS